MVGVGSRLTASQTWGFHSQSGLTQHREMMKNDPSGWGRSGRDSENPSTLAHFSAAWGEGSGAGRSDTTPKSLSVCCIPSSKPDRLAESGHRRRGTTRQLSFFGNASQFH